MVHWTAEKDESGIVFVASGEPELPVVVIEIDARLGRLDELRMRICCEVADWMNGVGKRPQWLDDMEVDQPECETLIGCDGTFIGAIGPFHEGVCEQSGTRECMSPAAIMSRRSVINVIRRKK